VTDAPDVGIKSDDAWQLGRAIAAGGVVESTTRGKTWVFKGKNGSGSVVAYANAIPPPQPTAERTVSNFLLHLVDYAKIGGLLQRYPQLHLLVEPVPPRDYSVKINGRAYDATEKALYGVASGVVIMVRIERSGKVPCEWSGTVSEGQVQTIPCTL
jgi:hypothetical protein